MPALAPVTTPVAALTLATPGLLLPQVPPAGVQFNVVVRSLHITRLPVMVPASGFTVAVVVPDVVHPLPSVTVRLYIPFASVVTVGMVGVWVALAKEFGPVHEYCRVATPVAVAFSVRVVVAQVGLVFVIVVIDGKLFTTAVVVEDFVQPLPSVTVNV